MKQARQWLADLSRGPARSSRSRCAPRRLLMPERLESRNAPCSMLPLLPVFAATVGEAATAEHFDTQSSERSDTHAYYRADRIASSPELHFSIHNFIETLRAEELANQHNQSNLQVARQTTEFLSTAQLAVRAEAFGSLFSEQVTLALLPVSLIPPPVIHPVEPPEAEPRAPAEPPASAPEDIAEPTPGETDLAGGGNAKAGEPALAGGGNSKGPEISPPMIQPVITDPDSEHNQPSPDPFPESPGGVASASSDESAQRENTSDAPPAIPPLPSEDSEVPPPMVQPVITDPDSEHNQPSPDPVSEPPSLPAAQIAVAQVSETHERDDVSETSTGETASAGGAIVSTSSVSAFTTPDQLSATEVDLLLDRATRVTARNDAIIAIVDRSGRILGVHVEQGVLDTITDTPTLVFAIDGAIAKARTAAFFSNNEAALTSRTVRFISQTTVTEREVEANPNSTDESIRGPGFVAPIGLGGHFPPDVSFTPHVDLFAIEHTNRDSLVHPGADGVRQTVTVDSSGNPTAISGDDIFLGTRFGANFIAGKEIPAPESYGLVTDLLSNAQSRGIATLPGGVPLYKVDPGDGQSKLVGGIGVFFPGEDGYATFEQGFVSGVGQTTQQRLNAPLVIEAEYTAALIASNTTVVAGLAPVASIGLPNLPGGGRIDLAGITLESFGPHPFKLNTFLAMGDSRFAEGTDTGTRMPVTKGGDLAVAGEQVPSGWLVNPTTGSSLTAQQVEDIIMRGVEEAQRVRAAIRLPLGERTAMVLAVTDTDGTVLGLFRMDDATFFSIDVAVAKARNVAYYADAGAIKDVDRVDADGNGTPDVAAGVAFTNRTFRYLAEPRFPSGIEGTVASPFSTLLTPGVNPRTAENMPGVTPDASDFTTVLGYDAFHPSTNFREDVPSTGYQNGIVFFPGSTPLYNNGVLVGGFGVSGDGVDQDDVVTFFGAGEFVPGVNSPITRADEVFVRDVRLPYQKFFRNPHA